MYHVHVHDIEPCHGPACNPPFIVGGTAHDNDPEKIATLLYDVLNSMSIHLDDLLQSAGTLDSFFSKLLANKVISTNFKSNPNFKAVMRDFKSSMASMSSIKKLEEHCRGFLQALNELGDPNNKTSKAAKKLEEEWSTVILNKMGIHFLNKVLFHLLF